MQVPGSKKIFINGRFLGQRATGVQKYALGITLAMQKKYPDIIILCPRGRFDDYGLKIKKCGWGRNFFWEQVWLPHFFLFKKNILLLNFCNTAPLLIKRQIITIHDLSFLKNKNWFSASFRRWYKFLIPKLCRRSAEIITVSEFTKKEICCEFSINAEKINVVSNGVPEIIFDEQKPFPFRYIFLTGIFNPRKNAAFVISQTDEIKKRNLHIVGVGEKNKVFENIEFPKNENLHLFEYADDKKYYTLLRHADALIFPSEYEGFGIPLLEALSIGTPVIAPEIPVYKESFGTLPIYYESENKEDFLRALDKINSFKPNANELQHLKNKFTFEKSAEVLSAIINNLPQHA